MQTVFELAAVLASGLFSGGALFVHFVDHPALMELGPARGLPCFAAIYKRAAKLQLLLALLSFSGSLAAWLAGAGAWWLVAGILMASPVPYTMFLMLPLNKELTDPGLENNPDRAMELLERWGNLHTYRSLIALAASVIFLLLLWRG
jgi:hypothetical protein